MIETRNRSRHHLFWFLIVAAFLTSHAAAQDEPRWAEAGLRGGTISTSSGSFHQLEAYLVHTMDLSFELPRSWVARSNWEMSAGRLEHEDFDGLVFSAGPVVVFRKGDRPWYFEVGSRPTLISEDVFGDKDFGGPFQFTSHGGVGWTGDRFEISYRIQHMSNARIYSQNDGLNLHVLEIGWRF
ncbi:MAG: acyloxyacyl hydrolase [Thermoanaerobaculia bacterium]|nr:acyloxyacyl hydrolase [Thermoanaerobaculia bacterium]